MLAYWYNAPRHIKLIFIIVVCVAVYAANQVQPLPPIYTILSFIFGFGLHIEHYLNTKLSNNTSGKSSFGSFNQNLSYFDHYYFDVFAPFSA